MSKDIPVIALHNRYARTGSLEYPPRSYRGEHTVYCPFDVSSEGTWIGFNAMGLFVAVTDQHSGEDKIVRRSRGRLVLEILRTFSKAREVTEYLKREVVKGYRRGNFVIADKDEGFHVLYDEGVTTCEFGEDVHVFTNLTLLPGMRISSQIEGILERAETRKKRALELAGKVEVQDLDKTLRALQRIAADHGEDRGRCSICYHDEMGEWRMTSSTIIAVKRNVVESRILYCMGNPCRNEFIDYSYLLKGEKAVGGEVLRKSSKLLGKRIALCLTGSVATIEAPKLARELRRHGAEVECYMTHYAVKYGVSCEVMKWATGKEVVMELGGKAEHLKDFDLVVVYPATFNTVGKIAGGIADNAVTTLCAATSLARLVIAPAMNLRLYNSHILQENLAKLMKQGATIVQPRFSEGAAKIAPKEAVVDHLIRKVSRSRLKDRRVLILTGPTRYNLDPVRYISNRSSGRLGYCLAREAFHRGSIIKVIYGPGRAVFPSHIPVTRVYSAEDMLEECLKELDRQIYDVAIFSAAILDFKPKVEVSSKVKSGEEWTIELVPTPKVIEEVARKHPELFTVAFKLEYKVPEGRLTKDAYHRLKELNAGLMVANDLAEITEKRHKAYIIDRNGNIEKVDGTKETLAEEIFNALEKNLLKP